MLIIYAHPNKEGHCGYFLEKVKEDLIKREIDFEVLDLYDMKYDPVLRGEEHYTSGHHYVSEENKIIQEKIAKNKRFVIIYPVWWNNMPAILKGFFDRIMVKGFAFEYRQKMPIGLLKGRVAIFVSRGAPRIFSITIGAGRSVKVLIKDILRFCGLRAKAFPVGMATKFTDKNREMIEKQVVKGLDYLR